MFRAEVRVLHEIQLVDGIYQAVVEVGQHVVGIRVGMGVRVLVARGAGRLQLQVVQGQRVRIVVQLVKVAPIQGEVRAAEAVIRVGRIVCKIEIF